MAYDRAQIDEEILRLDRIRKGGHTVYPPPSSPIPAAQRLSWVPVTGKTPNDFVVSSHLSLHELVELLGDWGCTNLTARLATCSQYPVGNGGFGDVHSGSLDDGTLVAIKSIRPLSADGLPAGKYQKRAAKELYAWSKCAHRNIVPLLGFADFRGRLAMVSPWAVNGTVTSYLTNNPSVDRCLMCYEVCQGLEYLHSQNIVHGDLKGANVLVSGSGAPMLTDFGNASLAEATVSFTSTASTSFSVRWTAPEILKESSPLSRAGDVYALGMTILEIISGQVPFNQVMDRNLYTVVVFKKRFPPRPEEKIPPQSIGGNILWALLTSCWAHEPRRRPSAAHTRHIMGSITTETLAYIESEPESETEP